MQKYWIIVLGILSFTRMCGAGELHEFRSLSGKSVKAEIVGYNGRLNVVSLKLPNRSIKKVKPELFVDADRKYIKKWALVAEFKDTTKFQVKIHKKSGEFKRVEEKRGGGVATTQKTRYDIELENMNSHYLENISVEYKIFVRTKGDGRWSRGLIKLLGSKNELTKPTPVSGAKECGKIAPSKTVVVETKHARSIKAKPGSKVDATGKTLKNQELVLEGIWVRVVMELDGETISRDVFAPTSLEGKHAWN